MIYRNKITSLIPLANKYQIKGYLVFRTAKTSLFKYFLKKGFGHVFAVIERDGYKILIDSTVSHSLAEVYPDGYDYDLEEGDTVVKFNRLINTRTKNYGFGLMSCVEIVKRFIGLNKYLILTPHQLYRKLS